MRYCSIKLRISLIKLYYSSSYLNLIFALSQPPPAECCLFPAPSCRMLPFPGPLLPNVAISQLLPNFALSQPPPAECCPFPAPSCRMLRIPSPSSLMLSFPGPSCRMLPFPSYLLPNVALSQPPPAECCFFPAPSCQILPFPFLAN